MIESNSSRNDEEDPLAAASEAVEDVGDVAAVPGARTNASPSYQNSPAVSKTNSTPPPRSRNILKSDFWRRAFSVDDYNPPSGDEGGAPQIYRHIRVGSHPVAVHRCLGSNAWAILMVLVLVLSVVRFSSDRFFGSDNHNGVKTATAAPTTTTIQPVCSTDTDGKPTLESLRSSAVLENLTQGAVAADHPICSRMGLDILQKSGGNAVDAAVTVALCLGVANPASSGLGGGAFLLVHADDSFNRDDKPMPDFVDARTPFATHSAQSGKLTEVIDCREVAPAAATQDMFQNLPPLASVRGGLAIGVPGELKGLELAHTRHGRLEWALVVQPVLDLAQKGVPVNANMAHEIQIEAAKYRMTSNRNVDFGMRQILTHGDSWTTPLLEGDTLYNPALADTLKAIRDGGADALYKGKRAAQLAKDIQEAGGITTAQDIENYRATLRSPVVAHDISGFSIVGVPPPSSGGAAIVGAGRFLAGYVSLASFPDTLAAHRTVEALKHVFAIRMSLSDPAFNTETVNEAIKDLLEGTYMEELRQASNDSQTLSLSQYGGAKWAQLTDDDATAAAVDANEGDRRRRLDGRRFGHLNDHGTSHFAIVDKDGNAVSMTTSVNTYFGSNVVSKSSGIVLSNTMDDFSNPGRPNYFGLHPSAANYIAPGKKPLSSMSPTMIFRRYPEKGTGTLGSLMLVIGASGGPKIISAVFSVIANYVLFGMPLFESVIRPRLHDQLIYHGAAVTTVEDSVLEQGPVINVTQRTRDALMKRGHDMLDVDYEGTVQAIGIDQEDGRMTAVCDVRKGGTPAGY